MEQSERNNISTSEKDKIPLGLSREEHGELNRSAISYPDGEEARNARIDQLRQKYQEKGNVVALQQIDVYDGRSEYIQKFGDLTEAVISGNTEKQEELLEWYRTNYPDIGHP